MASLDEQLARVAEKLRITEASGAAAPSGRWSKRNDAYSLNPPLSLEEVARFESEHRVRLPEEYRRFVTEVGNGDTGHGGLYWLQQGQELLTDAWGYDEQSCALSLPAPYRRDETYDRQWWQDHEGPDERLDQLRGTLPVQEGGCSQFYFLVVTGPDAGAIYYANWDGNHGPYRFGDDYLSWREESIDVLVFLYSDRWEDDSGPGEEAVLLETLATDPHPYRRMWAARSMRVFTTVSDAAYPVIERAFTDPFYGVRAMAVQIVGTLYIQRLVPLLLRAVEDESGHVRSRALRALRDLEHPELVSVARGRLDDRQGWLREAAVRVLHAQGELTGADVARLLDDPEWTVRRQALYCLPDLPDRHGELLAKALFDADSVVRGIAVDQVVARDDQTLLALLPKVLEGEHDYSRRLQIQYVLKVGPYAPKT